MSIRAFFQDRPMPYVWMWKMLEAALLRMSPLFKRVGVERSSKIMKVPEELIKG